ncbi:MAG: transposase [Burkholderiaceae bacterium]|nr:MAG: transposase [Burkholderiaceae bacterium]MBE7424506.1 transposase [Ideonella sp.]MCC7285147.1 transposase [Burkholderiaceae bacterium]
MARLTRLAVAGHAHLILLRGHSGQPVFRDDVDRAAFLSFLAAACAGEHVALHGYALLTDRVWLLGTPDSGPALGRTLQALGRGFSVVFNRRHARRGSLWDGRYRSAVVEAGPSLLEAMVFVDLAPVRSGAAATALAAPWTSARRHAGASSEFPLTDSATYWALGNTPFDRCTAYESLLNDPVGEEAALRIERAVMRGWALGSKAFQERLEKQLGRPMAPRPRGRPRRLQARAQNLG